MYYIGIDIGGTNIAIGLVDANAKIIKKLSFKTDTNKHVNEICDEMSENCFRLIKDADLSMDDINSIGIGVPGSANPNTGIVEYCANLFTHDWDISSMMKQRTGKQIFIENDANVVAFAENMIGSAKGCRNMVAVTLGTGIGGGIIIDGKLYSGFNFNGAEIGHMVIVKDGIECSCGRKGCFEKYASAKALVRQTKEALISIDKDKKSIMWDLIDNDIANVSGKTAFRAFDRGDQIAGIILENYFDYLSCGITNIINIFQPEVLCIGGGISKEKDKLLNPILKRVEADVYSKHSKNQTKICIASLGNDAGIIGAALLYKTF